MDLPSSAQAFSGEARSLLSWRQLNQISLPSAAATITGFWRLTNSHYFYGTLPFGVAFRLIARESGSTLKRVSACCFFILSTEGFCSCGKREQLTDEDELGLSSGGPALRKDWPKLIESWLALSTDPLSAIVDQPAVYEDVCLLLSEAKTLTSS